MISNTSNLPFFVVLYFLLVVTQFSWSAICYRQKLHLKLLLPNFKLLQDNCWMFELGLSFFHELSIEIALCFQQVLLFWDLKVC